MEPIVLVGLFFIVPAAVVFVAFLAHQDAERIGMDNPDTWFGIVLVTGGTGLLLYLFERDDHKAEGGAPDDAEFPLPGATIRPNSADTDRRGGQTELADDDDEAT